MRFAILAGLAVSVAAFAAADNPETLTERSQARARAVLDRAVEANGGAEALRAVDAVRLRLQGENFPRLQMTTPAPPFEGGAFQETLLVDLKNNRLRLEQKAGGFGFDGDNTVTIVAGKGNVYDNRARTVTPVPAEQASQQQFIQYHRRLPNLILRQALDRTNSLRYLGEDQFDGRRHEVVTFVMPDTQQVALYIDAASGLMSKYELIFVDALTGEEASEIIFSDYQKTGSISCRAAGRTGRRATSTRTTRRRPKSIPPLPTNHSRWRQPAIRRFSPYRRSSRRVSTSSATAST
ncbi:MAG: hypothetical protein WD793_01350 [Steroidobacteraceae bacterium]